MAVLALDGEMMYVLLFRTGLTCHSPSDAASLLSKEQQTSEPIKTAQKVFRVAGDATKQTA